MWIGLAHIRESQVYLSMGELLYNVIAVYIITVLIRISATFKSHYNLLAVYRYLSVIFSQQVSKFRYSRLKQYVDHIAFSYLHCSKTVQRHGVYIAAYDMQLLLLLYYLVPICRKLTLIYRQLGNNHLIQLLIGTFHSCEAGNYVSNLRFKNILGSLFLHN